MKSTIVSLLCIAFLVSCASYPSVPYSDLDDAIDNAKTDEEREYYTKRRDSLEEAAERAGDYLTAVRYCLSDGACKMVCDFTGVSSSRDPFDFRKWDLSSVDKLVRWYHYARNCDMTLRRR